MTCSGPSCDRVVLAKGLCKRHYYQRFAGKPLTPIGSWRRPIRPVRPHPSDPSLALVELTRGYFATISAVDVAAVEKFNWIAATAGSGEVYAYGHVDGKPCPLHRFIGRQMGLRLTSHVDHRNTNPLDCRRSNLRDATLTQNHANRGLQRNNKSGVKGVHWNARHKKWRASISVEGKDRYLGAFDSIDAAAAVVRAERERLHGEFANHGSDNTLH